MLKITQTPKSNKPGLLWIAIAVSVLVHFGFYTVSDDFAAAARKSYQTIHVAIQKQEKPKPPPKPKPEPEPKPKPKPKPEPKPEPKPKPKPNVKNPEPPPEPPEEPPKEVFGVTSDSVNADSSGPAVRVGNTLEKEMDLQPTKPEEVKPLSPPKPKRPKPVPVYELTRVPSFKNRIVPTYPDAAKRAEIEGVVQLEVLIDENGRVLSVKVLRGLGYGLDEAAVAAIKQSTFVPGLKGKQAVPVRLRIPFRFILED